MAATQLNKNILMSTNINVCAHIVDATADRYESLRVKYNVYCSLLGWVFTVQVTLECTPKLWVKITISKRPGDRFLKLVRNEVWRSKIGNSCYFSSYI